MRKTLRIAVFTSGSGSNLQALIDSAQEGHLNNAQIALVVGSKEGIGALDRAQKAGIAHCVMQKKDFATQVDFDYNLLMHLASAEIDLIVLAGYLGILSQEIIDRFPNHILNIHPALIPSFCGKGFYGMHVHRAVYESGVKVTGATVHFVDGGIDSGAILLQECCPIAANDTPESIQKKVLAIEHDILPKAVKAFVDGHLIWQDTRVFISETLED